MFILKNKHMYLKFLRNAEQKAHESFSYKIVRINIEQVHAVYSAA